MQAEAWTDFLRFARERHSELDGLMASWNPMDPDPWRERAESITRALGLCVFMWKSDGTHPKRVIEQAELLVERAVNIRDCLIDPGWPDAITLAGQAKETRGQWNDMREWARPLLLQVYGNKCTLCGKPNSDGDPLHIDHVFPVSKGGSNEALNLRPLCRSCNLKKGAKV